MSNRWREKDEDNVEVHASKHCPLLITISNLLFRWKLEDVRQKYFQVCGITSDGSSSSKVEIVWTKLYAAVVRRTRLLPE
jgi:hypothetical protein